MEHEPDTRSAEAESTPEAVLRSRPDVRRRVLIVAGILVGLLALFSAIDLITASPRVCASCHEIAPRASSWAHSAHAEVACVQCHQAPTAWYALPQRLVGRAKLVGHDVIAHLSGRYPDPVTRRSAGTSPVTDANCLQCHDPDRRATAGLRILIDHGKHARLNGSCISCHVRVAHPVATRSDAQSLMSECFRCHGEGPTAKAPARCGLCHPSGYRLVPASHQPSARWRRSHGSVAIKDPRLCKMCHAEKFCSDCHGLAMPHPAGWAQRAGHPTAAQVNRALCERCHGTGPDLCTMCHHKAYAPDRGPWVQQHPAAVRTDGLERCLKCHGAAFCANCHVEAASR